MNKQEYARQTKVNVPYPYDVGLGRPLQLANIVFRQQVDIATARVTQ
jgi:hypothetical protein